MTGVIVSWSLAAPPGPANAIMAHAATRIGFRGGIQSGLGSLTGNAAVVLVVGLGLQRVVPTNPLSLALLAAVGAGLLGWLAWRAWTSSGDLPAQSPRAGPSGGHLARYTRGLLTTLTNPICWTWWFATGTVLLAEFGRAFLPGFFAGFLTWCLVWSLLASRGANRSPGLRLGIARTSAAFLGIFAISLAAGAVRVAVLGR